MTALPAGSLPEGPEPARLHLVDLPAGAQTAPPVDPRGREHLANPRPVRDLIAEAAAAFLSEPWPLTEENREALTDLLNGH